MGDPPTAILNMLAHAFDPSSRSLVVDRRLKFENKNQGHSDWHYENYIAKLMRDMCKHMKYDAAAEEVSTRTGLSDRQVKRIYGKHKRWLGRDHDI
jgi:transcriptional regulator GlxA family with amidase domain